ncbi:peptidase M23 [Microbacterium sp.]|uniref:peptidase M23 n=1 Tax=Microbacterium sp. TaxID=51671 RepID=UPI0039E6C93A
MARRASTSRRRRHRRALLAVAAVLAVAFAIGAVAIAQIGRQRDPACTTAARYSAEQLDNAWTIIVAGRDAGLPPRDQSIAVMTALGESSLRNLDYGDWETDSVTNPDGTRTTSIGLFQQQDGWGTRAQRLDPYTAAALFYRAMTQRVPEPERSAIEPTLVAHRTQINGDPQHYASSWDAATALVAALDAGVPDCG